MLSVLREVLLQSWRVICRMNGQQVSQLKILSQQHYRFESSPRWLPPLLQGLLAELESIARELEVAQHSSTSPQEPFAPGAIPRTAASLQADGPFCAGCPVAARCAARDRDPLGLPRAAQRSGGTPTPSLRAGGRVLGASGNDALPRQ